MFNIIVSILSGVTIVTGRIINSNLAKKIGMLQGTFFNYVVGLLFSIIFLVFSKESFLIPKSTFESIPLIGYLGGIVGVLTIALSNYITPKISAFYLTLFIFIGQLFTGVVIDYITLGQLSLGKVIGGILVFVGLAYNLIVDKKEALSEDCETI